MPVNIAVKLGSRTAMKMKMILLMALCLACCPLAAQRLEENITSQGRDLLENEKGKLMSRVHDPAEVFKDSLEFLNASAFPYTFTDSLGDVYHAIPSRKWLQKLPDSLRGTPLPKTPLPSLSPERLVERIRSEFYDSTAAALHDGTAKAAKATPPSLEEKLPGLSSLPDTDVWQSGGIIPLSGKAILSNVDAKTLPSGRLTPPKALGDMDSLRSLKLRKQHLRLDSLQIKKNTTLARFRERQAVWRKPYYELLLGAASSQFKTFQIAPAIGLPLGNGLSVGLGPSLQFQQVKNSENRTVYDLQWSVRGFVKKQFLHDRAYAQLEDHWLPPSGHTVLAGGGYLLALSTKVSLNIGLFYKAYTYPELGDSNPLVIRLGLSTLKLKTTSK